MSAPVLTPSSEISTVVLPITGNYTNAADTDYYAFGLYSDTGSDLYDASFVSGAYDQVAYTYKKLGGDVLDVELTEGNIYTAYEEAVLEYSYIVNLYQGKSILGNVLGDVTGTFDHDGMLTGESGLSASLSGTHVGLKYPKFDINYAKRVGDAIGSEVPVGGTNRVYSCSFDTTDALQDYDLQGVIASNSLSSSCEFYEKVGNNKVAIRQVYYKTPHAMWRFYGFYGGLNSVGNLSSYGQYADDSTFDIIPPWQNKLQAMAYEDAIYTRNSHYSFELYDNHLRIYPSPTSISPVTVWVKFTVETSAWDEDSDRLRGTDGINNLNTIPFGNLPYKNINSIGKQWIRRFALSVSKEMLGQIRGKFQSLPIPGDSVTLNASDLLSQAKEEQEKLREELKTILDELTYDKVAARDNEIVKSANELLQNVPNGVFIG